MHDEYQEDDIYNEAARRLGRGDIVAGKEAVKNHTNKTLNEIKSLKRAYIPAAIICGFFLSLSFFVDAADYARNISTAIFSVPISTIVIVFLVLCLVCFNFGRIAQYYSPLSKRLLSEYRNIPPEIESLFDDLRKGSWEASIGGVQMPSYLLDSPWRMLLVGGADVRERRDELWCIFRPKLYGDIRVRKVPSGLGLSESPHVVLDRVSRESHGTTQNNDTSIGSAPAKSAQANKRNTRENRLLREFELISPEQAGDLIKSLQEFHATRKVGRHHEWPGQNEEKWKVIFQVVHDVAITTERSKRTNLRLIDECRRALDQAKADSRIDEVGLKVGSPSSDWVKSFVHDAKGYGWIHEGIFEFNRSQQEK